MVFVNYVRYVLSSEAAVASFLEKLRSVAEQAQYREGHTLSFEVFRAEESSLTVALLERFRDKGAFTDLHLSSKAVAEFREFLASDAAKDIVERRDAVTFEVDALLDDETRCRLLGTANNGVLVFCGARVGTNPQFCLDAAALGACLAARKRPLVYGGGTVGVMGSLARSMCEHGGKIQSVIPRALAPVEQSGESLGTVFLTDTMSERKSMMFALASTVVALPGGLGTMDELCEVLTQLQLNSYRPKIGILNSGGYFDPFFVLLQHLIAQGFLNADAMTYMVVASNAEELMEKLDTFTPPPSASKLEWMRRP